MRMSLNWVLLIALLLAAIQLAEGAVVVHVVYDSLVTGLWQSGKGVEGIGRLQVLVTGGAVPASSRWKINLFFSPAQTRILTVDDQSGQALNFHIPGSSSERALEWIIEDRWNTLQDGVVQEYTFVARWRALLSNPLVKISVDGSFAAVKEPLVVGTTGITDAIKRQYAVVVEESETTTKKKQTKPATTTMELTTTTTEPTTTTTEPATTTTTEPATTTTTEPATTTTTEPATTTTTEPATTTTTEPATTTTTEPATTTTTEPATTTTTEPATTTTTEPTTTMEQTTALLPSRCYPPSNGTLTTVIKGTAHHGRTSVEGGEKFVYKCIAYHADFTWTLSCPGIKYPPNSLTEYKTTCLGNDEWSYKDLPCCPKKLHGGYVGCYSFQVTSLSHTSSAYADRMMADCQKSGKKYTLVYAGNNGRHCLTPSELASRFTPAPADKCDAFSSDTPGFMGSSTAAGVGETGFVSIYESFYGCYAITVTDWFVNFATHKRLEWSTMQQGDCNNFCLSKYPAKMVYTITYKGNECYCLEADTLSVNPTMERDSASYNHNDWTGCQQACAGGGPHNGTGCGSANKIVVQHSGMAESYPAGTTCFTLFKRGIREHGYYLFAEGFRYCSFYDGTYCNDGWLGFNGQCYKMVDSYTTTSFDDAEYKCADEYDAHLMSILDSKSGSAEEWTTQFLDLFAGANGVANGTDIWIGGYDPSEGGGASSGTQNFMWTDGTLFSELPKYYDFANWENSPCLYATYNDPGVITVKNRHCTAGAKAARVICQRPSEVRDGVRSYGCWARRPRYQVVTRMTIPTMEGRHSNLTGTGSFREKPWTFCKLATGDLVNTPTVFGISEGECYSNDTAGHLYMAGGWSDTCAGGYGSTDSFDIFESADIPQGYIGCYEVIVNGSHTETDEMMTVTACREICYAGAQDTPYQFRYAALKNDTCHCFQDFPSQNNGTRTKLSSCNQFCPGNSKQRCGNSSGTAYAVYSAVKYYPLLKGCADAAYQQLPIGQYYRYHGNQFWFWRFTDYFPRRTKCNGYENAGCPDRTWYYSHGHCVKISLGRFTRASALAICRKAGGDLFRPENSDDLYHIIAIIRSVWALRGGWNDVYAAGAAHATETHLRVLWSDGGWTPGLRRAIYDPYNAGYDEMRHGWKGVYNNGWNSVGLTMYYHQMLNYHSSYKQKLICSAPLSSKKLYIGCSTETAMQLSTTDSPVTSHTHMHVTRCMQICSISDIKYAMVTGQYCRCLASTNGLQWVDRLANCGESCPGMHLQDCGKTSTNMSSVYDTVGMPPARSCMDYYKSGYRKNGRYPIDPDGPDGETQPYRAQCNFVDNSADCDYANGWVSWKGRCYLFATGTANATFDEAVTACESHDALLASPSHGFREIGFIDKYMRGSPELLAVPEFYVGVYQMDADTYPNTGDYHYLDSGMITDQRNFHANWNSVGYPACVVWKNPEMQILPVDCNQRRAYICRKDPPAEMMCTRNITAAPLYTVPYHRMSNSLCRLICQGKGHDYAATNFETCSCYSQQAVVNHPVLPLRECNIGCPTIKYQRCGGANGTMLVTHSHPYCPAGWSALTSGHCFKAMDKNVTFWNAVDICEGVDGVDTGLTANTGARSLRSTVGRDLWVNPYRRGSNSSQFFTSPGDNVYSWTDSINLSTENGRCSAVTSSRRRLADCDNEGLAPLCARAKEPTIRKVEQYEDLRNHGISEKIRIFYHADSVYYEYGLTSVNTHCKRGSAWFADFESNCYTYVALTSEDRLLTACRDLGSPRAVIRTQTQHNWMSNFRQYAQPILTKYKITRAITGTYEPDGDGNLVSMDGTYWRGPSNGINTNNFYTASSAVSQRAYRGASAKHLNYVTNRGYYRSEFSPTSLTDTKGVLCEISRAFKGCYTVADKDLFKVYEVDYQPNTVYQCVENCRAHGFTYIAITGAVCYCSNQLLGTYETDQGACWGRCANTYFSSDICGNSTKSTTIYIDISDSVYNTLAPTCSDLRNEGVALPGTYKLSTTTGITNFYCHADGEEYGLHLTRVSNVIISASSNKTGYPPEDGRIHLTTAWIPNSNTDQWWQVIFERAHIISAILSQGNGVDLQTTQMYSGSYAGSFTLTVGLNPDNEANWYSYNEKYMVEGAETRGAITTAYFIKPPITRVARLSFPNGANGYSIAGRFELIGYPYHITTEVPNRVDTYAGHTYHISLHEMSYSDAEAYCKKVTHGGYLAVPDDEEEHQHLFRFRMQHHPSSNYSWIGVSDTGVEGRFLTSKGVSPFFTKWSAGEPSNSSASEDCTRYNGEDKWEMTHSADLNPALCEADYVQPSAGAQAHLGCYLDTEADTSEFYPGGGSLSATDCNNNCYDSGHMFSAYKSKGDSVFDLPFNFPSGYNDAYVKVLSALNKNQELSICFYYKPDPAYTGYQCLLGTPAGDLSFCKSGTNHIFFNRITGQTLDLQASYHDWVPICIRSGSTYLKIIVGSVEEGMSQSLHHTTSLAKGAELVIGQGVKQTSIDPNGINTVTEGGKVYWISPNPLASWWATADYCRQYDAWLAYPESQEEWTLMKEMYTNTSKRVHIGVDDLEHEGRFLTIHGAVASNIVFTEFAANNHRGNQHCVQIITHGGRVIGNDGDCKSAGYHALCTKEVGISTGQLYGQIKRFNVWKSYISNTQMNKYKARELYGDIVSSEDPADWPSQFELSSGMRVPEVPSVLGAMDLTKVRFTTSHELATAKGSHIRITDEKVTESGSSYGGGWCAGEGNGIDRTWKVELDISYTVYSIMVKPRSLHYTGADSGRINNVQILHNGDICVGASSCTTFYVRATDYTITLPFPITTRDITIKIKGYIGKPCGRFEIFGFPAPKGSPSLPSGVKMYAGHMYHMASATMNYADAKKYCASALPNGYLTVPNDGAEQKFVMKWKDSAGGTRIWLGVDDIAREGKFVDKDNIQPVYTDWPRGEPNNHGGNEDCGLSSKFGNKWNDVPCSLSFAVLCESDAVGELADVTTDCACGDKLEARVDKSLCDTQSLTDDGVTYRDIYRAWRSHCPPYGAVRGANTTGYHNILELSDRPTTEYMGCWRDAADRAIEEKHHLGSSNTIQKCIEKCKLAGFMYAGLQFREWCFCGNEYKKHGKSSENDCKMTCSGDTTTVCGGGYRNSVYMIGNSSTEISTSSLLKPMVPGTVMKFTCDIGYTAVVVDGNNVTECKLQTRSWSTTGFHCRPAACQNVTANATNATIAMFDHEYQSTINYTCIKGHYFSDNKSMHTSTCEFDEIWTITEDQICEPIRCPDPPVVLNSTSLLVGLYYSHSIVYDCAVGYAFNPNATSHNSSVVTTLETQCSATGSWTPALTDCLLVRCPPFPTVENSTMVATGTHYMDNITYTCYTGYAINPYGALPDPAEVLIFEQTTECLVNGSWSSRLYDCYIAECPTPPSVADSTGFYNETSYVYNTSLSYQCYDGTAGVPNGTRLQPPQDVRAYQPIVCAKDGSWVPQVYDCQTVNCPDPVLVTNSNYTISGIEFNSTLEYDCDFGYSSNPNATSYNPPQTHITSQTLSCLADGLWEPIFNCTIVLCPVLPMYTHSVKSYNGTEYTSNVTYTCHYGYKYDDGLTAANMTTVCQSDGTWTQQVPDCIPNVCLDDPMVVAFSSVSIPSRFYENNATISCYTGYEFPDKDKSKNVTCTDIGTSVNWTSINSDACQRVVCPMPELNCTNILFETGTTNGTHYYKEVVRLTAEWSQTYFIHGLDDSMYKTAQTYLQCQQDEMWNISYINCTEKFTVPPGAYVRNADYYWSFNEWADSGALEIFQNTGEYSFGLFNASTSFIEQKNDSIHNGSTWYTVKFSKLKKQCITIPGFENVNHSCLVDPTKCSNGLSMEVWLKFQKTDFDSKESQTILASGNTRDAGHGGIYVSQLGRQISVLVANGSVVWLAEKALPNNIKPDEWFNLAFRWNAVKGIQVFINGMLIEEIPFSTPKKTAYLPADNKLYVGCRKHELVLKDFTNVELDELAFWRRYLFDSELKYFTGSIIDEEEIVDTVFDYKEDIVELLPPPLPYQNPYYRVADVYEPCDNENVNFGNDALVNITRGGGEGVLLPQITGTDVTIPGTQSANVGDLDAAKKLSVSFWLLPDVDDSATAVILKGSNWHISVDEGNITVSARYTTSTMVNETRQTFIVEEVVSVGIITGIWTNVAFSWNNEAGVQLYVNGKSKASEAYVTKTNKNSQLGNADKLVVMKTTENITISDIVIWKRDLYPFEVYRFLGMSPSEAYLDTHADLYWSTDYYVVRDKASTNTLLPLYKTVNSTVKTASKAGMAGHSNKGEAMEVSDTNGWVMLGMTNTGGKFTPETGEEFAGTCLSDPSLCGDGVTVALWLKIYEVPKTRQTISIMTSGEEDSLSRGFSITMQEKHLNITLVDGKYYWKVSMLDGKYPVDDWMHLAFSWKADEGLWVFMNGELVAANKDGVPHIRTHDRYSRITLGRNNANNAFGGFMSFAFQEIAVYFKFTVTYRIREIFALIDNAYYEKADKYFNKDMLITGTIENLKYAKDRNLYIGPIGTVDAKNNTISLGEGATLTLEYLTSQDCIANPAHCAEGITVSTWTRNNLLLGNEHPPVFLLSSHQKPEEVRAGRLAGWTIYYIGNTFMVSLVSETTMFNITISEMAKPLLPQRWTNIGFTWSKLAGMTVFLDGQVAGIMKYGHSVSPTAMNLATPSLAAGHTSNDNKTFIDIYNVAIWQRYYFGSKAYQLTGHREDVILKYSAADLMWPFDGPVHMLNTKFSEMLIRKETYDSSLKGAALQVTRDGRTNASLGNYSSECLTQPSSCTSGFQLGMQLKLANYVPGNEGDKFGSILLLGSPDANFEGVAIQMVNEAGVDKISVLVANDRYIWRETIEAITNAWFDLVIGWNINDGIAMKVNNKRKYGTEIRTFLEYGSSKLITNKLILGVGSGGGTNQGVDAQYNDVTVTYNGNVNEEQEGRCYDSAALDYRLNKGQILTMENVLYTRDRQDFKVSAFNLDGDGYVELDQFAGRCYSDPGLCADGLSLSAYLRVYAVGNSSETLLGTGFPTTQGYQMQVTKAPVEDDKAIMTVSLNDGERTWQVQTELALKVWVNIGFAWNATKGTGLALFVDGALKVTDDDPRLENKPAKRSRTTLVIGRGNDNADTDFSHCVFDDIGIWDKDVRAGTADSTIAGTILKGQACQDEGLVVKTEVAIPVAPTTMNISGATDRPVGCRFYDPETGLCSANSLDFFAKAANNSGLTINNLGMALKEYKQDTAKFTVNTTNPKVVVENFVQTIGSISTMPMKKNIDPTEVEETLTSILTITGHLFNGDTWKNQWQDVESNSSTGAASVISDIDDIALKFTQNMAVGLDKADDCSAAKAACSSIIMSGEKRRLALCDRPYTYPQYEVLSTDKAINDTLHLWKMPSDKFVIPFNAWKRDEHPDDTIVVVAMVLYNAADSVLPTRVDLPTFINLDATTSADNPVSAKDKAVVLQVKLNSRVMSITVSPPLKPPLEECVEITLEHTVRNEGNKRTAYCTFFDHKVKNMQGGAWSSKGCDMTSTNESHTVCCCYHLTSFAVMMEPLVEEPVDTMSQKISYMIYACTGLSLLSLLIFCLIIICSKSLRNERSMVHLNLSIAMIFATTSYLLVDFVKEIPVYCQAVAIAQHYFFMVAYAWILMEALCLFYAVLYGELIGRMKCYAPIAWRKFE